MINASPPECQSMIPVPPTRLLGREDDIAALTALLDDPGTRLVTLTGPGGVGKTHLALELARAISGHFADGVVFVPVAPIREPGLVLPAIAQVLGIRETPGSALIEALSSTISRKRMLIVLDNLEQVLEAAPDIGVLLAATEMPVVLATSRSPLHLRAEREFPVDPLPTPDVTTRSTAESLAGNAAVTLFIDRAQAVRPSFTLTDAYAPAIAEICRRLDGLPLAIELVAAMTRVLSPQALLDRIERRLHLEIAGATDLPDRQRTLQGTIAWSVALLLPNERSVFRRLAVFSRTASLDAIEKVCGDTEVDHSDMLSTITSLVDKSLLRHLDDTSNAGEPHFRMLTTIREYATALLDESGEGDRVRSRHLDWLLELAAVAERELTGPDQVRWLQRLDNEHDNIRSALDWSLKHRPADGMRLASMVWRYWATRSLLTEGHSWLSRFLEHSVDADDATRARAFSSLGNLSIDLGDYPGASAAYLAALEIWERLSDTRGRANALNGLGLVEWYQGDYVSARSRHEAALAIRREINDRPGQANSLTNLGNAIKDLGDIDTARSLHEQALAFRKDLGDQAGIGYSYINLSDCARREGDHATAREMSARSLEAFRSVGDTLGIGYALHGLSMAHLQQGNRQAARSHVAEALAIRSDLGDRRGIVECIEVIATLAASGTDEQRAQAVTLFGASGALREQIGAPLPDPDRLTIEPVLAGLRRTLSGSSFTERWNAGTRMQITGAVALATTVTDDMSTEPVPAVAPPHSILSDREMEVVELVVSGLTNAQVADRLYLSRRTVDAHLRRIYDKLELSSRAELVRHAVEHDLVRDAG